MAQPAVRLIAPQFFQEILFRQVAKYSVIQLIRDGDLIPENVAEKARINDLSKKIFDDEEIWKELADAMHIEVRIDLPLANRYRLSVEAFYKKVNRVALEALGRAVPRDEDVFIQTSNIKNYLNDLDDEEFGQFIIMAVDRALAGNQPGVIQILLQSDEEVARIVEDYCISYLFTCVETGEGPRNNQIIKCLLRAGISVDVQKEGDDEDVNEDEPYIGFTPLMIAAGIGNNDLVEWLIAQGASLEIRNNAEETALFIASRENRAECLRTLIAHHADVNAIESVGSSALMMVAMDDNSECAKILVEKGADVNLRDQFGRTALMYASEFSGPGSCEVVRMLLRNPNTDINARNNNNKTALDLAEETNHYQIAALLFRQQNDRDAAKRSANPE